MQKSNTLLEALDHATKSARSIGFLEKQGKEQQLSYTALKTEALLYLGALQDAGLKQGDQLVISVNDNPLFIRVFWACVLGGIVPVPVGVGISQEHRNKLLRILGKLSSAWLLAYDKDFARIADTVEKVLPAKRVVAPTRLTEHQQSGVVAHLNPDDTAFIQFSSGSTSDPKGVVLTHRNLLANIAGILAAGEFTDDDISLSWMPLTHDMGLIGFHLSMLVQGIPQYLMPTDLFSRRPLLWMELASAKKATVLCSPNFGYKHYLRALGDKQPEHLDLAAVRLIFNGAEPISVSLIDRFMSRMQPYGLPDNSMFTVYGLAEASLAVAFPKPGDLVKVVHADRHALGLGDVVNLVDKDQDTAIEFAAEGHPVPGCLVRLCDAENRVVDNGSVGRVQISGENVTSGYYQDEANNAVSILPDGWVDTGDLGFFCDAGLVITGRDKDIIFAHGLNYYPHDLENVLVEQGVGELGKVVAAGFRPEGADEDALLLFLLYRKDAEGFVEMAQQTRRIITEQTGLDVTHVLPVKRVPKTTSGKIQRRLILDDYAAGNFDAFIAELSALEDGNSGVQVPHAEIAAGVAGQIKAFVDEVIPEKSLAADSNFFDAGISSLALAEIHQKIEDEWPGVVDIVDLFDHQTITEVAKFIEDKQA